MWRTICARHVLLRARPTFCYVPSVPVAFLKNDAFDLVYLAPSALYAPGTMGGVGPPLRTTVRASYVPPTFHRAFFFTFPEGAEAGAEAGAEGAVAGATAATTTAAKKQGLQAATFCYVPALRSATFPVAP